MLVTRERVREVYEPAEMEIIRFREEDVIVTSGGDLYPDDFFPMQ